MRQIAFIVLFMLVGSQSVTASNQTPYPQGMSIVLQIDDGWELYIVNDANHSLTHIKTSSEPRTPTFCAKHQRVAYISAEGALREINLREDQQDVVLLQPNADAAYTQPAYGEDCESLYVVQLKQGKSVDTDIIELNGPEQIDLVTQRSAQFEPYFGADRWLYYGSVSCVIGCGRIIQDLWRLNTVSGVAEQLSLQNAISREPVVTADGERIYFSSNKRGYYHIWELNLKTQGYRQLTDGAVVDSSPSVDAAGVLHFLRKSSEGIALMVQKTSGAFESLALPAGVAGVRDLEIARW